MRITRSILAVAGGVIMAGVSPSAFAGSGCLGASNACNPGINVTSSPYQTQPMGIHYAQPYDYLRTVSYNQTPQMNVMRIETGAPMTTLSQAPAQYWGGCNGGVTCAAPAAQAPVYQAPAPVVSAPRTHVASQDYKPENFASRQYGDNTFVPGIAHVPTSYVERSPVARDLALANGGAMSNQVSYGYASTTTSAPAATTSSYGSEWNKVSGPTMIDGMLATEVVCKQPAAAPVAMPQYQAQTQAYRVVRPIVAVPYPVPVECRAPAQGQAQQGYQHNTQAMSQRSAPASSARYGNSSWSY